MIFMKKLGWLFQYENLKKRFTKLGLIILILVIIGLVRLALEVIFDINLNGKWYSFDKDIIFVMCVFPFYLCFFLSMCAHLILTLFRLKTDFKKLFLLFFFLQISHIIIPFFDYIGFKFGIPWTFQPYLNSGCCELNPFLHVANLSQALVLLTPFVIFFTHPTLITMGINIVWIFVGFVFERYLAKELKVCILKRILIILILFQIIYWPIYKYFFIFDEIFKKLIGLSYYNHYGYGLYFLFFAIIGVLYFYNNSKIKK